jgi:hypothetical protein
LHHQPAQCDCLNFFSSAALIYRIRGAADLASAFVGAGRRIG